MAQFQEFVSPPAMTRRGPIRIGRFHAVYLAGAIVLIVSATAIGLTTYLRAEPQSVVTQASTDVTDGWMPAITHANQERTAERARATVDGWAAALLKSEPPVVDGWASRYLVSDD